MKVTMAKAMAMAIALTMLTLSMMTSLLKVTSVIIFYSAKKRSNNKRKRGGIFKILLARAGSNQSLEKIQHCDLPKHFSSSSLIWHKAQGSYLLNFQNSSGFSLIVATLIADTECTPCKRCLFLIMCTLQGYFLAVFPATEDL